MVRLRITAEGISIAAMAKIDSSMGAKATPPARIAPENTVAMPNGTELHKAMMSSPFASSSTAVSVMKTPSTARGNR